MSKETISLWVNEAPHRVEIEPGESLLSLLRDRLGLTGTKNGCGEGHCGACTVIVDGRAVRSCVYPAARAEGKRVETIEGLARDGALHPLQRAFITEGAVQCGFCTPGMIMAAKALLDRTPNPSDAEIRRALRHNLCRCTGYSSILRAVRAAQAQMRAAQAEPPDASAATSAAAYTSARPLAAVGRSLPRPDARAKVTGQAVYSADLRFPGMLHAKVLRSRYPHARLLGVDTRRAAALPGVVAVLTARDVPGVNRHGLERPDWPVLCDDKARYIGDAIAVAAAETEALAAQALELIEVAYEPLEVVDSPERGLEPDAPLVHESGNVAKHIHLERGDLAEGWARADVIVERTYRTARAEHAFLEPECSVAVPEADGRLTVYVGSQIPFDDRRQIAAALGLPESQVRVVHAETGGTFGGKEDIAGQIHAALAAWVTRRPVRLLYTRPESIIAHPKRHPTVIHLKTGATREGKLVALEARILGDTGAYASLGPYVMTRTATHATGPYEIPHVWIDCHAVYTNNIPSGAFRGFGVPQAAFAMESQMDLLAEQLGLSPWEIRRRNAFHTGSLTATGQELRESVGLLETLDRVQAAWRALDSPWAYQTAEGKRRGWGLACAFKNVGLGGGAPDTAGASVEITTEGHIQVRAGAAEVGQGLVGVLAQIAAEELGVGPERAEVLVGDTALTLDGGATTASRQTYITGNAARLAAQALRETLAAVASAALGKPAAPLRFADGRIGDGERWLAWEEAVALARGAGCALRAERVYRPPETRPLGQGGDMHFAFGYATQAAEVEVDPATGEVTVLRVIAAHDVGQAINPLGVIGQVEGGVVMGAGLALTEDLPMRDGLPLATNLAQYRIPTVEEVPEILPIIVEDPAQEGPYGAKGIGEIPSIPTAAAIANAIHAACGARVYEIPATPERVREASAREARTREARTREARTREARTREARTRAPMPGRGSGRAAGDSR